jgi:hypothetical protein
MANLFDTTGNDYLAEPTQDTQLRHSFGPGVFNATTAPTVNDDELDGFRPMSHWYDSTAEKLYICVDSSEGAAVWEEISLGPGGGGSGDVVGPASSTDNAVVRYDGTTGKLIQNSTVTLSDVGTLGNVNAVDFDLSPSGSTPAAIGRLVWDTTENTLEMGIGDGDVTSLIGVDNHIQVYQQTGSSIPRQKVVYVTGSSGLKLQVALAQGNNDANNAQTIGVTAEAISNNGEGYVITRGLIRECDTSAFNEDDVLWIDPDTAGEITNVRPTAPDHAVRVGYCIKKSAAQGIIYVDILNGFELDELHNVYINGVGADHFLVYDSTVGETRWENRSPADARTALGLGSLALQGDGDKGDITVASSGASWTIDAGVVDTTKLGGDITTAGKALLDDADASAQRTTLGLGTIATQNANNVSITGGTATGLTDSAAQFTNTGLEIRDNQIVGSYNLTLAVAESLTAARTLSIITNDASRTLTISGNATVSGTNTGDQTITLTGDVTGSGTGSFAATIANGAVTNAKLQNSSVTVNGTSIALGASGTVTATATNALTIGTGLSGTSYNGSAGVTIAIDSTVATLTGSQTLSNKSIALGSNTVSGTKAQFDTAVTDDNFAYVGTANAFTGANTFTNSTGQIFRQAATQDGVLVRGRAGGTSSYTVELIPTTLTASRIVTFPDAAGTVAFGTGTANQIAYWSATNTLAALSTATYPSLTELAYVKGVTSAIQTQINAKFTLPSFTAGSVIFSNGTTLAQDNTNFYWDDTANTLLTSGAGTAGIVERFTIASSGNGGAGRGTALLIQAPGSANAVSVARIVGTQEGASSTATNATFRIDTANSSAVMTERLRIHNDGNISVGSTTNSARLHLLHTTEQLRLAYDSNNFTKFTVGSGGTLTIQALSTNGATASIINFSNTYVQFSTGGNISSQGTWFPYSDGNNYISATSTIFRDSTNTTFLTLSNTSATYIDGVNMAFGTTTGTKIGTATTQKIGFYNATPIVQVTTAVAAGTFVANTGTAVNDASTFDGYTLKQIVKALRNLGLLA